MLDAGLEQRLEGRNRARQIQPPVDRKSLDEILVGRLQRLVGLDVALAGRAHVPGAFLRLRLVPLGDLLHQRETSLWAVVDLALVVVAERELLRHRLLGTRAARDGKAENRGNRDHP